MTKNRNTYFSSSTSHYWDLFTTKAGRLIDKTREHILKGVNPGGVYHAIWCRDASYILKDWFLSGNGDGVMQQIYQIWSHQIIPESRKTACLLSKLGSRVHCDKGRF